MTVNFCSCSMRLWRPRNCFSLLQSLKAVTSTTMITENKIAAPSIQPACDSPSSSTPPVDWPHTAVGRRKLVCTTRPLLSPNTCRAEPGRQLLLPSSSPSWSKGFPCAQERVFTSLEAFGFFFYFPPSSFHFSFLAEVGLRELGWEPGQLASISSCSTQPSLCCVTLE